MLIVLARNWFTLALRGMAAIVFGLIAFFWPGLTLTTLILLFGAYALVDGLFSLLTGIREYGMRRHWRTLVLEGLASALFGILALLWPGATTLVLLYLIAAWAVLLGVVEFMTARRLRRENASAGLFILNGLVSMLFGLLLITGPGSGALALTWLIGVYALIFGMMLLVLALRMRGWMIARHRRPFSRTMFR